MQDLCSLDCCMGFYESIIQHWGFRRCEDICWIQTNHKTGAAKMLEPNAAFQRTKEHCLMGIKGTVRRSTDGSFIHANVDIDLIIDEEPDPGSLEKPIEMFRIIEHFCLGTRRLHIFGRDTTIRPGKDYFITFLETEKTSCALVRRVRFTVLALLKVTLDYCLPLLLKIQAKKRFLGGFYVIF